MPFDPFDNKNARSIVAKVTKGKAVTPLKKLFEKIVAIRASGNLELNAINNKMCEECLALAEIVASGRGNGATKVKLPAEGAQWLSKSPDLSDELATVAKDAVDEVRKYSAAWAIAEDIGYREWFSYCRGLSTRLNKPQRKAKVKSAPPRADAVKFFETMDCWFKKDGDDIVDLRVTKPNQLNDSNLEHVLQLKKLKSLTLHKQKITDKGLEALSALKKLESLSILDCAVTPRGFQKLKLPRLKHLRIGSKKVNETLANCHHLRIKDLDVSSSDIGDPGLKTLSSWPALEQLDISNCRAKKGTTWKAFKDFKKIKGIRAAETVFPASGFEALLTQKKLRELSLRSAKFPVDQLSMLGQLKQLQTLSLSWLSVPEAEWEFLGKLKKLKNLRMASCPHVTDSTIEIIAKLPSLETLDVGNTSVTNKSEKILADVKTLRSIDAHQSKMSRTAQDRLSRLCSKRWPDEDDDEY